MPEMLSYYSVLILLSCFALCALSSLVWENARISRQYKKTLLETYLIILLAILAEWGGVMLNGAPSWTIFPHKVVKFLDYSLTPMIPVLFLRQLNAEQKLIRYCRIVLIANTVLQGLSVFTGWTFGVNAENIYVYGPLHFLYIPVYVISIGLGLLAFWNYGKQFRRRNRLSLGMIVALLLLGIGLQEFGSSEMRTFCLTTVLTSILLYLHTLEFRQLTTDAHMLQQEALLQTDALTGLLSRYAYTCDLAKLHEGGKTGEATVFSLDINGLKEANDTLGHAAGDELIRAAAACASRVFAGSGRVYRTGGDEFVVLCRMDRETAEETMRKLQEECAAWHGETVSELSLSAGFAIGAEHPELEIEKLIVLADQNMYAAKEAYYSGSRDRRRR